MKTILFLCLVATLLVCGCQSGPKYHLGVRKISVETEPSAARVYQKGPLTRQDIFLGTTPLHDQSVSIIESVKGKMSGVRTEALLTEMGMVKVRIEKEGYKTYEGNLSTNKEETVLHTIKLEAK
jgi:hypothetical protein